MRNELTILGQSPIGRTILLAAVTSSTLPEHFSDGSWLICFIPPSRVDLWRRTRGSMKKYLWFTGCIFPGRSHHFFTIIARRSVAALFFNSPATTTVFPRAPLVR